MTKKGGDLISKELTLQRLSLIKFVKCILLISLNYAYLSGIRPPLPGLPVFLEPIISFGYVMGILEFVFAISILYMKRQMVASLSIVTLIPQ